MRTVTSGIGLALGSLAFVVGFYVLFWSLWIACAALESGGCE
jgi:hypothetical protein